MAPNGTAPDPEALAHARRASLRYVDDNTPGIARRGAKPADFRYFAPDGKEIRDPATLERIRKLAIPPAWRDVWICPDPRGHIQATARDARGRKQYRYHPRWREVRDEDKYARMIAFGRALPKIRARIDEALASPGLSRDKVLAAVVRLLERTLIRIGNDEYARSNRSYGLTTLQDRHVRVKGRRLRFSFRAKSGKFHEVELEGPRVSKVVRACQDLPGQELFQYIDENGRQRDVTSSDVNQWLREVTGQDFTAKDFRTWAGTVMAALCLHATALPPSKAKQKQAMNAAVDQVAAALGNTRSVCRKSYVHPLVFDSFSQGTLAGALKRCRPVTGLDAAETAVLSFLCAGGRPAGGRRRRAGGPRAGARVNGAMRPGARCGSRSRQSPPGPSPR